MLGYSRHDQSQIARIFITIFGLEPYIDKRARLPSLQNLLNERESEVHNPPILLVSWFELDHAAP
jgi:hypothetical protein